MLEGSGLELWLSQAETRASVKTFEVVNSVVWKLRAMVLRKESFAQETAVIGTLTPGAAWHNGDLALACFRVRRRYCVEPTRAWLSSMGR